MSKVNVRLLVFKIAMRLEKIEPGGVVSIENKRSGAELTCRDDGRTLRLNVNPKQLRAVLGVLTARSDAGPLGVFWDIAEVLGAENRVREEGVKK